MQLPSWLRNILLNSTVLLVLPWLPIIISYLYWDVSNQSIKLALGFCGFLAPIFAISIGNDMVKQGATHKIYVGGRFLRFSGVTVLVFLLGHLPMFGEAREIAGGLALITFIAGFAMRAFEQADIQKLSVPLNRALEMREREQIISEYGSYIENHPPVGEIRDVSELPYSKEQILDAITLEIVRENNDQRVEAMKACAIMLADFQENVGPKPLTMLGISTSEMLAGVPSNASDLKGLAAKITENPEKEKYEALRKVADEELINIQCKLMAAEELRRQIPEAKKRQTLG